MTTSGFHHADIKNKYFTRNVCSLIHVHTRVFVNLDSVSIKTSIVKSHEITKSWDGTLHNIVRSFWYLIGIPAEMLPRHLSNIKAMWSLSYTISRIGNVARSYLYFHRGRRLNGHWSESRFASKFRPRTCLLPVMHRCIQPTPRWVSNERLPNPRSSDQAKSSDDKSSTGLKFVIGRLHRWNFRPVAVYPPIAPSTCPAVAAYSGCPPSMNLPPSDHTDTVHASHRR